MVGFELSLAVWDYRHRLVRLKGKKRARGVADPRDLYTRELNRFWWPNVE
jgi:hypothetical protein